MPTPDASQFTTLKKYTAISEAAISSAGTKISRFYSTYVPTFLSTKTLFLPSANKDDKIALEIIPPPPPPPVLGNPSVTTHSNDEYAYIFPSNIIVNQTGGTSFQWYMTIPNYTRIITLINGSQVITEGPLQWTLVCSGATTDTLAITSFSTNGVPVGSYLLYTYCVVTNQFGSVTSSTVNAVPTS